MATDPLRYAMAATKGEVAGVAIQASVGFMYLAKALRNIRDGADLEEEIRKIDEVSDQLDELFNALTGWKA